MAHKTEPWPVPPLFEADWRDAAEPLVTDLRRRLTVSPAFLSEMVLGGRMAQFRFAALPFWPGWAAGEVLMAGAGENDRVLAFLYGPFGAELLEGRSDIIHDINERRGIQLDTEARREAYLRFFTSAVRGDDGAFFLVESDDRLGQLTGATPQGAGKGLGHPIRTRPGEDGASLHDAVVLYGGALFRSTFLVSPDGLVTMEEDQVVVEDHPGPGFMFDGACRRSTPRKGDVR